MAKLTNDLKDLRSKNLKDLESLVLEIRENQFKNRMKHKTGQLNESHLLTADRKKIAKIKTVINEKKSEEESA
ncbi:MAG: 50S ribosomal protein L29 [SAR86 cluster bacterium BACL1 MAG-120920-bin57]|jgi:large subunit ribosomal protein L29|uniref:Large ribosomal subunit protein uL29 n=2 Tax=SAR86 cluster TaxID=62672 RepID=A0A0R2U9K0_9GAMM|nr:MAG: 50S ribosomal protein L29 [SAR86 cluster bacterium BACL1 MAG-120507-bin14]KRO37422.1 MAG: 50S ribosomal protein L29 [SAR86 cluster bacterium BACL1 MAG-120920-bin57]KRO96191.1 MAG: 50S ribosomal protein L29 [SAR86 cluster bacterium BACL1 MAG-120820-bin45]KRO97503.1 MAG: 50S ribosomal protein L29 [SAR86 cluster bacterium BACL1 MAG-120828-bin5]KRO98891.1 MAG: 50S ribosomal protein L29 [SAR86 cluster bacterium BACL1 MAG-120823-bin87]KRP00387.1 MAG: 50S ribosomal protein L29 [SAR86 cluster 